MDENEDPRVRPIEPTGIGERQARRTAVGAAVVAGVGIAALVFFAVSNGFKPGVDSTTAPTALETIGAPSSPTMTIDRSASTTSTSTEPTKAQLEGVPEWCPVTVPGVIAFTPLAEAPEGPPSVYDKVWYGTPDLWTMINPEGEVSRRWLEGDRTFWWSQNYSPESPGEMTLTAEQINGSAPTVQESAAAGSGFNPFTLQPTHESVTMVVIALPGPGCWELAAEYQGANLSYVLWIDGD